MSSRIINNLKAMNKKIIWGILVAIVVIAGIYFYQAEKKTNYGDSEAQLQLIMADWKTYTNTQYGFEFKYPSTAELRDYSKSELSLDVIDSQHSSLVQIYVQTDKRFLSEIEKEKRQYFSESDSVVERTVFSGIPTIKITMPKILNGPYDYYIIKDGFQYVLSVGVGSDPSFSSGILSTFKFTK